MSFPYHDDDSISTRHALGNHGRDGSVGGDLSRGVQDTVTPAVEVTRRTASEETAPGSRPRTR